jgi:mannosyl-3-phosphoglycerate phosphatase
VVVLGTPRVALLPALAQIAAETGARLRSFAELVPADLARVTGLSAAKARRALAREHDEPFLLDGDEASVSEAAERRGLRVTRGGRFHHLHGPADKGLALSALLGLAEGSLGRPRIVALGDSPNDASLLAAADHAIAVPLPGGEIDPTLAAIPGAERAPQPGPAGWNSAVLAVLNAEHLSAAAEALEAQAERELA